MRGGISQKGNNYYVYLWIGGKKKWFSGAGNSKRKAEMILHEKAVEVQNGTYQEIKKIGFRAFGCLWLESYAKTKTRPSTFSSYEDIVKKKLTPIYGDRYLTTISEVMLQRYVAERVGEVKPKTVCNEIVVIKEMFKHAVRWGYLKVNPAEHLERPKVEKEEMEILTPGEIGPFLEEASIGRRTLFLVAILTGMRRGEILGLKKGDIDWHNLQIGVKRTFSKGEFGPPKTKAGYRKIDMSPYLAHELKKHILRSAPSESDLVFCGSDGKPLDPDNLIKREFLPALSRAGVKRIRFQDLRHTNASLRIEQGQNIKYIQKQMGHASIQTTLDRYGHLLKDVHQEQAVKLDAILGFDGANASGRKTVEMVEVGDKKGFPKDSETPVNSKLRGLDLN